MVDGSDLVSEHLSQLRTGRKLSSDLWTYINDLFRGALEHTLADK